MCEAGLEEREGEERGCGGGGGGGGGPRGAQMLTPNSVFAREAQINSFKLLIISMIFFKKLVTQR